MDYINTQVNYEELKRLLSGSNATAEENKQLQDIQFGHDSMLQACQVIMEKNKASIFRLFKRMMTKTGECYTPAYKLGIMSAMDELGIRFIVKDEQRLMEKMEEMERLERRQKAMQRVLDEEL